MVKENLFRKVGRALANLENDYDLAYASAEFCSHLVLSNNPKVFTKLHKKIQTSNQNWIYDFVYTFKGLLALLFCLDKICLKKNTLINSLLTLKCLSCIKEIMNSKHGMDGIISLANEDHNCIQILAKACSNTNQLVKKEVFQIFSGIAIYSEKGYLTILQVFEGIKKINSYTNRFTIIINELKNNSNQQSGVYLTVLVGFINCLISQPAQLRKRLQMRFEFQSLKLMSVFDELKILPHDDLLIQIDQFEKLQVEDEKEAFSKDGFDLNNVNDVSNAIYVRNNNSSISNQKFLELLQLILFNMEDELTNNVSIFNRLKEREKKFSDREKTWNILIETVREIMVKSKKLRNLYRESSTQTDFKIDTPVKKTIIIRDYEPKTPSISESITFEEIPSIVVVETPKDDPIKEDSWYPEKNDTLFNKLTWILSQSFGYLVQRVAIYIIDFIQDWLTSKKTIQTKEINDCSTQTNFLNHINDDLKIKLEQFKKSDIKKLDPEKPYMQITQGDKPIENTTSSLSSTTMSDQVTIKPEINVHMLPLPIPSDFKYSSTPLSLSLSQPPSQPILLTSDSTQPPQSSPSPLLDTSLKSESSPPPKSSTSPSPSRSPSIERKRSMSPDEPIVESPPRKKSPSPPPKLNLPRSHIALRDKDFALSLANIRLRKVNDIKNSSSSEDTSKSETPPKISFPPGVPPPPPPLPPSFFGGPSPPPPPPLSGMVGIPPPPPPPMPASLLAQILNPNAHFARSSSVPPEQKPVKEEEIELELNDHRKLIYDLIPKPSRQLKICNWQKLPRTTIYNLKSVWREVNNRQDEINLDYSQLEELFVKTTKVVHRRSSVSSATNDQIGGLDDIRNYGKIVSVLDPKYTLNLTVFLKKLKLPVEDYIKLILKGKSKEIGVDNLSCLQKILPSKKDVEKVQNYCKQNTNAMEKFGRAEQFVKLLSDIPFYDLRINLMNFYEEFDEAYDKLESTFDAYIKCLEVLLKNESLKLIFGLILATGNFLNMNSWCGQAVGFRIDLLPKLSDVKTNKPSITLLHVIVEQFEKMSNNKLKSSNDSKNPNREFEFLDELSNLKLIISVGMSNLNGDYQTLKKNTIEYMTKLKKDDTPADIKTQFLELFKKLNSRIKTLTDYMNKIERYKLDIIDYYCEDPLTFNYDDFFKIFHDFCNNVIRARQENKNRIINEDRIAKRKQKLEELKKKSSNLATLANETDSVKKENVLNSILANIKSGKALRKTTKKEA